MGVEHLPIRRCKVVSFALATLQVRADAKDSFAIAPSAGAESVAGGKEDMVTYHAQSAWCPDAAASRTGLEADRLARVAQGQTNDPAVILAAIAKMAAEGDIDSAVEKGERRALVLDPGIEMASRSLQGISNVNGPARENSAVCQRQSKNFMAGPVAASTSASK